MSIDGIPASVDNHSETETPVDGDWLTSSSSHSENVSLIYLLCTFLLIDHIFRNLILILLLVAAFV